MPGKWDTSMKRLLGENPEHFIKWLLPGAELTGTVKLQPPNLNDREIEADNLCKATLNKKQCLVNFEFQSYRDDTMAKRMWEYNVLATFSYNLPTYSFVIYLKKCKVSKPFFRWKFPTGKVVHYFRFTIVKLWEIPPEVLKQTGLVGIFPLMVLAQGGKRPEVVEEVITSLKSVREEAGKELLSLTYILASLVFEKEADRRWLKRRFKMLQDILRDTWAYQEIMQEGREEGLQKGLEEGREKGLEEGREKGREEERQQRLKDQRQMLMTIVEVHFSNIAQLAQERADAIKDPEVLQGLILKLVAAQNEVEAKQILLAVSRAASRKKRKR
jgi:predicted transposase YdaD